MNRGRELLSLPVKAGLWPLKQLGHVARELAAPSARIVEQREAEDQRTGYTLGITAMISEAQLLRGRIHQPHKSEAHGELRAELDELEKRIGQTVVEAAGSNVSQIPLQGHEVNTGRYFAEY